ncbi:hypothetical protein BOTBODRAFT_192820 [Botryobasidium botryosum FD-172 SS1]|uniref:Major facilitator superfamily (MFS) profile domain-containing protein n=1 Tax=Botryobasidium botryosum (strain FD-172 SS1) TaxID=930990 RepID=A0A067M4S7_BOTB1|nr:hypothetical protein BOTBODRAFT_192820 [Botryobasidium botryosum FD-172 SS1]
MPGDAHNIETTLGVDDMDPTTRKTQPELPTHVLEDEKTLPEEESEEGDYEQDIPDGGLGWLMAVSGSFLIFSSFGFANSWGVQYYRTEILQDTPPATVAWIGSIQYCLILLPSALTGYLMDHRHFRGPLHTASVICIVSVFLVAECKKYWQFMLVQGVLYGLSAGFLFGPILPLMQHWFRRRRATAYGITATGSSTGGTVLPIVVRKLIPMIGFKWTIRVVGFIFFLTIGVPNLVLRTRYPPTKSKSGLLDMSIFKSAPYSFHVAGLFVSFLGMYTVLTYIDVAGVSAGLDPNFTFYLVSIANAGSAVGRLSGGLMGDRIGPINTLIPMTLAAAVTTFAWPYCTTKAALIPLAILYGMCSGVFMGICAAIPSPPSNPVNPQDRGRMVGMLFTIASIGSLVGPPISGAIHDKYGGFHQVSIYAGCMIVFAAVLLTCARQAAIGRVWGII